LDGTQQRLGIRLKKFKTESNLTWKTIAKESGVSYRWLLDIASGRRPSAETRKVIREYFSGILKRHIRF
jgi:transcriptional regulator with XRE-family HTH domain